MTPARLLIGGLSLCAGLVLTAPAQAVPVVYSTSGSFDAGGTGATASNGDPTSTLTFGAGADLVTVRFEGVTDFMADATPSMPASSVLGFFSISTTRSTLLDLGNPDGTTPPPAAASFTLTITESSPSAGSDGSIVGTIGGSVQAFGGEPFITFSNISATIGTETYTLNGLTMGRPGIPDNSLVLLPPFGQPDGISLPLTASIATAIPEPSSIALMGIGVAGMIGYGWRRRRQAAS